MRVGGPIMDTEKTTQVTDTMDNQENVETVEEKDVQDKKPVDAEKIAKKLQKRISKEQESKHQALKEVEELKAKLAKYENNDIDKGIKELSDEEKAKHESDSKDRRIQELEGIIARNKDLQETKQVFEESGISVPDNVLDMVVVNDNKKTVANVQAITNFIEKIKEDTRNELLAGRTPRVTGVQTKMTKEQIRNIKDTEERQKAMRDNWSLFS